MVASFRIFLNNIDVLSREQGTCELFATFVTEVILIKLFVFEQFP